MYSATLKRKLLPEISFGVAVLLFVICPLLSLPYIIKGCLRNEKNYYFLASLFMGLCALILFLPIGDHYRHAVEFYRLKGESWSIYYLSSIMNGQVDFLVYGLFYITNSYNLPFGINRAILTSLCSFLFLSLYDQFCRQCNYSEKEKKWILLLVFMLFPMSSICSGMRYATGICFIVYVFTRWSILNKRNFGDYIILVCAVFTHTGCLIPIILYVISMFISNKISRFNYFVYILISFILSGSFYLLINILPLPDVLASHVDKYVSGEFSDSGYLTSTLNIIGKLFIYITAYGKFIIILYVIIKSFKFNSESKFIYILILSYVLTINIYSINGRIGFIILLYGGLNIIMLWKKYIKKVSILLSLVSIILFMFSWRYIKYYRLEYFVIPVIYSFNADYDEKWIEVHVNEEGTIKDYW